MFKGKTILVTGGTGSFGQAFIKSLFEHENPKKIIVFSRDEFKQYELMQKFNEPHYPIRYFIGDIRDKSRLYRAFEGVDYVVHAAAMKQVSLCEYNPFEAVQTNIIGAQNIAEAAIDTGVEKVIALSTDKAVNPVNLYGSSKLSMEKIFIAANNYVGEKKTSFSIVRYGNVIGSRGSVIPLFTRLQDNNTEEYPVTDKRMTRFWITLQQGIHLVLGALNHSIGGEVFIPKIPSMKIVDIARGFNRKAKIKEIGIRPGEKLHEMLISEDEGRHTIEFPLNGDSCYLILPEYVYLNKIDEKYLNYTPVEEGFTYQSDTNPEWMTIEQLKQILQNEKENS